MILLRALRRASNGQHVVYAHHQVGNDDGFDRAPQLVAGADVVVALGFRHQQLDAYPQQQQRANDL